MVRKAFSKTILRSFKSNISKVFSMIVIMFLGIAFVSGLGTVTPSFRRTMSDGLKAKNIPDIILKSTSSQGFEEEGDDPLIFDKLKSLDYISNFEAVKTLDSSALIQSGYISSDFPNTRFYGIDQNSKLARLEVVEGRLPEDKNEICVEQASREMIYYEIGDTIDLGPVLGGEKTIVGIVSNPLIFSTYGELDNINQEYIEQVIYLRNEDFVINTEVLPGVNVGVPVPVTDIYIILTGLEREELFSTSYISKVDERIEQLEADLNDDSIVYLSLEENVSYAYFDNYIGKINIIAWLFPVFFIAVVSLVISTTMSRMVEEERSIIGCYRSLGVSDNKIKLKYVVLTLTSFFISFILGMILGLYLIPSVIYPAFEITFYMPSLTNLMNPTVGIVSSLVMLFFVELITILTVNKSLKERPASLLQPLSPKAGKKNIFERIKPLWNHLAFRYKSTIRNLVRYKKHFIMTITSVAGSTALTFAGLALIDIANSLNEVDYPGLKTTIIPIAVVVIVFAILLTAFVIYNLTNMNISERSREIATLKVLGYHNHEVIMYIYREIIIMSTCGIIVGLPIGFGVVYLILYLLEFGSMSSIFWYTYLISVAIVYVFIFLVDAILIKKINGIDMSNSLKAIE